jgi:uncharacterized protein YhaN
VQLQARVREQDQQLEEYKTLLAERDAQIARDAAAVQAARQSSDLLAEKDRVIADKDRIIARKNAKLQKSQRIANALRALQADDDDDDEAPMLLTNGNAAAAAAAAVSDGGYSSGAASSQPIYAKQGMHLVITIALCSLAQRITTSPLSAEGTSSMHSEQ